MERVKFKKNFQKQFISETCKKVNLNLKQLSTQTNVNYNTLKGYFQERRLMPKNLALILATMTGIKEEELPIEKYLPSNWGASKGGKKGMNVLSTKYKQELIVWRKNNAKVIAGMNKKKIKKPVINEDLAEFIGAYLGDGTLTPYFVRITGDPKYDLPYFLYLESLVENLFDIKSKINITKKNILNFTVSSKELCNFLHFDLGLPYGDKIRNKSKIPLQLLKDLKILYSCLRGLIDTDGFVGGSNNRLKIVLTSHNKLLLKQIDLLNLNLFNESYKTNLEISSKLKVAEYFKKVGSSNLRHIIRYLEGIKGNFILKTELLKYYPNYFYIKVPYLDP